MLNKINQVSTGYERINKATARKMFGNGEAIYILPIYVNIDSPYLSPLRIENVHNIGFDRIINKYKYINCNYHNGRRIYYYKPINCVENDTIKELLLEIIDKFGKSASEYYPTLIECNSDDLIKIAKKYGVDLNKE